MSAVRNIIAMYNVRMKSNPVLTNIASAFVIFVVGDVAAQISEKKTSVLQLQQQHQYKLAITTSMIDLDKTRSAKMVVWGVCFNTPFFHGMYSIFMRIWPVVNARNVALKVVSSFACGPFLNSAFLTYCEAFPHIHAYICHPTSANASIPWNLIWVQAKQKIDAELWNCLKASAALWPIVNVFNFALVPPHLTTVTTNFFAVLWSCYLSLVQHRALPLAASSAAGNCTE